MSEKEEKKLYRYLVTLRWFVETGEELVAGSPKADEKILEICGTVRTAVLHVAPAPHEISRGMRFFRITTLWAISLSI